jgi:DeoR family transcriptional regulator of aga operon
MSEFTPPLERQHDILDLLARNRRITVDDICGRFSVSKATARRDLEKLALDGKLQRVHGGAISLTQAPPELPILLREQEQVDEKRRIGRAAAALVKEGETVFLGSGTTVLEVARSLRQHKGLTIITNSLPVLNTLAGSPHMSLIATGGMLRDSELSFIGHITEQALSEINADRVIMGIRAISVENGLTNNYLPETMTDRAILRAGREVIIVADHTKCGVVSTAFVAPLKSIQKLVTDNKTSSKFISALEELGIGVIVV